jgi:tRNA nucleotidyltransferase (CCA-adding enzyme)
MTKQIREAFTCNSDQTAPALDMNNNNNNSTTTNSAIVKDMILSLTPEEEKLFQTLENAAIAYENGTLPSLSDLETESNGNGNSDAGMSTGSDSGNGSEMISMPDPPPKRIEIRIAGGWVRDKILNHASHDVDVALDSLSGLQFAAIVQRYLLQQQQLEQQMVKKQSPEEDKGSTAESSSNITTSNENNKKKKKKTSKKPKIAVIAANPNQSKHLETATMNIHSIDVDFVHLRGGETYTSDSRIPTLKENATPLDDALRRDFTVNSLFYNVRHKVVEDYTGRGMVDLLDKKMLVTPIDANLTFHDDPLRVLRAIRFGVRYNLTLNDEIVNAARSKEVHDSLHVKVSRERVGKELEGMLSGKNAKPQLALKLMTDLKLAGCVFSFPPHGTLVEGMIQEGVEYSQYQENIEGAAHVREGAWEDAASLLSYACPLLQAFNERIATGSQDDNGRGDGSGDTFITTVDCRKLYLSTFLHPFRKLTYVDKKMKTIPVTAYMIKESIKFPNKDVKDLSTIMENVDEMKSILNGYFHQDSSASSFSRLRTGMVLRRLKDLWVTTLLVAAISEIRSSNLDSMEEDNNDNAQITCRTIDVVLALYKDIKRNNLDGCWKLRPLIDGKTMVKYLELPRGPIVGTYLEEQVRWMLINPEGSKNDCEKHLRDVRKRDLEASSGGAGDNSAEKTNPKKTEEHCSKKAHLEG